MCPRRHSFDVARTGYVNLLQPQDRKSAAPGDSPSTVEARRRALSLTLGPLVESIGDLLTLAPSDAILDIGCGEGHHLAAIVERSRCEGHGIDISVPPIDAAAKRYPRLHWIVANADRLLPYAEASFAAVVSITARKNASEFRRVLRDDGALLVVVPAPDDLIELREAVLGEGVRRNRTEAAIETFAAHFRLDRCERVHHVTRLDPAAARDVMTSSYRALRTSQQARLARIRDLDVTLSWDALLFRPARTRARRTST